MKRPFAVIGFTSFAVLLILSLTESCISAYCVFFLSILIGILSLFKKNLRQALTVPVLLFTAAVACLLFLSFNSHIREVQKLTGDSLSVEATVAEAPYIKSENGRHYCVLKLCFVDNKEATGRLRLSFSPKKDGIDAESLKIGNKISFTGKIYIPGENEKSISRYFTGENILLGAYAVNNISITESTHRSMSYYFNLIRQFVSDRLCYGFGDRAAGLLIGMLTGDKSGLDSGLYDSFRKTGVAHLLAVSGMHLSLWVFALGALIPEKRKSTVPRALLLMAAVIFIMLLAGMSESVRRAGFMSLVFLCAKLLKKDSDSLNSLGLAVTVMLAYNPACVLSLSLQLSFLSTLAILTLGKLCIERSAAIFGGKKINTPLRRLMRYITDMFFISISVLAFTLPVLVNSFGGFSAASAWVNILIQPVVAPLLILGGLCVLLSVIPFLFYPLALITKALTCYVIFITELFAKAENAYIVAEKENTCLFIAAAAAMLTCFIIISKHFKGKATVTAALLMLTVTALITGGFYSESELKIRVSNYDGTLAAAVQTDKNAVLIFDTDEYEKRLFISELREKGIDSFYELTGNNDCKLKSLADGKYISDEAGALLLDDISFNSVTGEKILSAKGKHIHIFYGEALQCEDCCDIIIQIQKDGVTVTTADNSFFLKDEKSFSLSVK